MNDHELYQRQELLKDLQIPEVATVVGCGGTGFWTAVFLAMSGVKTLILIDPDSIEASNLNRLPLRTQDIGLDKITAVKNYIYKIRTGIRFESYCTSIDTAADCSYITGSVFCCTDSLKSQQLICAYARKNNLPYQRIGYDGTVLNVSTGFPLTFKTDAPDGYQVTPSWVVPAVLAAAAGVSSKLYKSICIMDDLGTLHTQGCSTITEKIRETIRKEGIDVVRDLPHEYQLCSETTNQEALDASFDDGFQEGQENARANVNESILAEIEDNIRNDMEDEVVQFLRGHDQTAPTVVIATAIEVYYQNRKKGELDNEQEQKEVGQPR